MLVILEERKGCRLIIINTSLIAVKTQRCFRSAFPHGSNERERERVIEKVRERLRTTYGVLKSILIHTKTHIYFFYRLRIHNKYTLTE